MRIRQGRRAFNRARLDTHEVRDRWDRHALTDCIGCAGARRNAPGPRTQLRLAGVPVSRIMFWVPQSGRMGLGISILSQPHEMRVVAIPAILGEALTLLRATIPTGVEIATRSAHR